MDSRFPHAVSSGDEVGRAKPQLSAGTNPPEGLEPPEEAGLPEVGPDDATVRRESGSTPIPPSGPPLNDAERPAAGSSVGPTLPVGGSLQEGSGSQLDPGSKSGLEEAQTVITDANRPELPLQASGAGTPAEVAKVLLGHQLDHFELESLIGSGGMGAVFRARDTRLDRTVALKVIPRVGDDPELLRRFRNEAQSAARLDHPCIARVYDVGRHQEWHYIVFEYIEGTNLRDLVAREGLLDVDDAIYYTRQVAEALDHAHRRGVTHRDIKPSNVLVTPDGLVKLVDMGLARAQQLEMSEDMTASGVTLGTFDYISPEQARDPRNVDVRSDIYSLGCTLYFVLTGRPPYPSGTVLQKLLSHGSSPPPDPRLIRSDLSDNLVAVLHKMLAKQPNDRYRKPLDLISDLYALAQRENLPRSLSAGSIAIAPDHRFSQLVERHLPWIAAVTLLIAVTAWLQLLSLAGSDLPITEPGPAPPALVRTADRAVAEPAGPEPDPVIAETDAEAESAGNANLQSPDEAAEPPRFEGIPAAVVGLNRESRSSDSGSSSNSPPMPSSTAPAPALTTIRVIGPGEEGASTIDSNNRLLVTSFEEAIEAARNAPDIKLIELAAPIIRSGPVTLPRRGLTIRGTGESNVLSFVSHTPQVEQRTAMFDLGPHSVDFEDLHLVYRLPESAVDGGAMFTLAGDNTVRFSRCSITVENPMQRDAVYAFETRLLPSEPSEDAAEADADASDAKEGGTAASSSPPLVAIQLSDVIVRGQMSMLSLDAAALVQLVWDNGLLAVSQRMIESAGALTHAPAGAAVRMTLRMSNVTASPSEGLVAVRLSPELPEPVVVDRLAQSCVFTLSSDAPLVEMNGLSDVTAIDRRVILRGKDNHYDSADGRTNVIVLATSLDSGRLVYGVSDLLAADKPYWTQEESPQGIVLWDGPMPVEIPTHLHTPYDYLQQGVVRPGFQLERLPELPLPSPSNGSSGI
ncbi:serine/threonine-protein kinase [Candidatus Laterigemmans baculatus]|uniref:serine/threonine-protein kinase n=1 Tax=Candidatus Laterigemmans baculatus TaxID=2770505 RepID=UPI0013D9A47F|nr:serine/threonine-protein kinase [Candidatus Laterigemmans baculatus]